MKNFKRQWRELSDEHREKISQSSYGRPKSATHRQHISQAMKDYWKDVPHRPHHNRPCQCIEKNTKELMNTMMTYQKRDISF